MEAIFSFDYTILKWISTTLVNEPLTVLMCFITKLGDAGLIWILLGLLCLLRPSTRKCGCSILCGLLLSLLVGNLTLKPFFARLRPFQQYNDLMALIPGVGGYSFPSGHSGSSFAAATAFFLHHKKTGIFALLLAGCIAFSRLYVCVHFPTDVIAGSLLGALLGWSASKLIEKLGQRYKFFR